MTRVLHTFLVGLVVSLGALVSGGSGVAWAGNWNLNDEQKKAEGGEDGQQPELLPQTLTCLPCFAGEPQLWQGLHERHRRNC